jgi:putative N6-adenine-specific DNA methylase
MNEKFEIIVKTLPGLEQVLAEELAEIGAENIEKGIRMVSFEGDKEMMYKANFCLRTAIRVLKPIKKFKATTADEVYEAVKDFNWDEYMTDKSTFNIDAVVYSEDFRHSKFVVYRVKDAIADYFREKTGERPSVRINNADLCLNIHIAQDDCTLSLDSSGESLHRRGYRQASVDAPINEVLAAGIILLTGWKGDCDFIDPMCGSGTFPIEADLIARNIYPGIFRQNYAFEKWKDFDSELYDKIYNDDSKERPFEHKIYAYDSSPRAIAVATENIKAAGAAKDIVIKQQNFQQFEQPTEKSIMVTNPPYGERISSDDLLELYHMIGERLKHAFCGNAAWIISYHDECFTQIGLKPSEKIQLVNGSLECELHKYEIFAGRYDEFKTEHQEGFERRQPQQEFRMRREYRPNVNHRYDRDDRQEGEDRPRRFDRDDRRGGDDRPRRFDRDDRRGGDDRPPRRFDRDDRRGSDDRPPRRFDRDDRRGSDDRPPRRFDRDDRRGGDDRPPRRFDRDDRWGRDSRPRHFEHDDRPKRDDRPNTDEEPKSKYQEGDEED